MAPYIQNTHSDRLFYISDTSSITPKPGIYDRANPALTQALFKLITGQNLTESDKQTLRDSFTTTGSKDVVAELQKALSISEDNFKDELDPTKPTRAITDHFDRNPLGQTNKDNPLDLKRMNMADELERVVARLSEIFGEEAEITVKMKKLLDQFKEFKGTDGFTASEIPNLGASLRARLNGTQDKTPFAELNNEEFWLVYAGAVAKPDVRAEGLLSDPTKTPNATPEQKPKFDFSVVPSSETDAREWHSFLTASLEEQDAGKQEEARFLLRSLRSLEEVTDPKVFEEMLEYGNIKPGQGDAEAQMAKFNKLIKDLRAQAKTSLNLNDYSYDPQLQAGLEAIKITTTIPTDVIEQRSLTRALALLEKENIFREANPDIQAAIKAFGLDTGGTNAAYFTGKSPAEKRLLLLALLREAKKSAAQKTSTSLEASIDPQRADPGVMFDNFKRSVIFLHDLIHNSGRSEAGKRAMEEDFVRYMQGGELSPRLQAEFTQTGKQEALAEALNYFSKGIGNSRFNVGMVRSLFGEQNEFNIADLVVRSDDFTDVAGLIQQSVYNMAYTDNRADIPKELIDPDSASTLPVYIFNPGIFAPKQQVVEAEGKKTTVSIPNLDILERLSVANIFGTDESRAKIKVDQAAGTITDLPDDLRELMVASLQGAEAGKTEIKDPDLIALLTQPGISTTDAQGNLVFTEGGAPLLQALARAIEIREKAFREYQSYDPDSGYEYSHLVEGRNRLIEFSNKNGLEIFAARPFTPPYHVSEYQTMLQAFASDLTHLEKHAVTNIADPKSARGSSMFASAPAATGTAPAGSTAPSAPTTPPPSFFASVRGIEQMGAQILDAINGDFFGDSDTDPTKEDSSLLTILDAADAGWEGETEEEVDKKNPDARLFQWDQYPYDPSRRTNPLGLGLSA